MVFDDFDSFREAITRLEGDLGAGGFGELDQKFSLLEEAGWSLGPPIYDRHEEVASPSSIADGPNGFILEGFGNSFEGTEPSDATPVDLSDGLGGGDANAGTIIATGAGADDDGVKLLTFREFREKIAERGEEIAFLRALAGESALRQDFTIAGQDQGGIWHAGFESENPFGSHGRYCDEIVNFLKLKNSAGLTGNPCAVPEVAVCLRVEIFTI